MGGAAVTAVLVKVIIDRFDGAQQQYVRGSGRFRPSLEFPDVADQMLVGRAPVPFSFRSGSLPFVMVIANDTAGPQQDNGDPGWSWVVEYDREVPGCPQGGSYWVLSTNGTTQRLSTLATAPVVQPGSLAVSSVNGKHGAVVLTAADTGADTAGAAAAAQAAAIAASDPAGSAASAQSAAQAYAAAQASAAQSAAIAASDPAGSAAAAAAASLPVAQTFALANATYKALQEWTVTGQTDDPLPPFGLVAGSQTYSWPNHTSPVETTRGPAYWWGYNPALLSTQNPSSAHGGIGVSVFADAGDSWNPATGGHGQEFNVVWVAPNTTTAVNAIQVGALDDTTATVVTTFRCGTGSYLDNNGTPVVSQWQIADASGQNYLRGGPFANSTGNGPGIVMGAPVSATGMSYWLASSQAAMQVVWEAQGATGSGAMSWTVKSDNDTVATSLSGKTGASLGVSTTTGNASLTVAALAGVGGLSIIGGTVASLAGTCTGGTAQFTLNGNGASINSQIVFQKANVNKWVLEDSSGVTFFIVNNSGNPQMQLVTGVNTAGNYDLATTTFFSKTLVSGSMVVNNGGSALATTATTGFLYIPTCAGTPTGTPAANAGSVPLVYDTTGNALNIYRGGAWHAVAI